MLHQLKLENKLLLLIILLCTSVGFALFVQVVMDDAYIPFRYGYNLIHYGVWNFYPTKEYPVESYTTFVYAALSVIPPLLHIHPYILFKMVGGVCFFGIIRLLYKASENKKTGLISIVIFTLNWQTYVHTFSGLETMLWCWLLLKVIVLTNQINSPKEQKWLWIICLLLPLTRPEGVLIGLAAFIYLRFIRKLKIHYAGLIICILIGVVYFFIRWKYFGTLLPLSFYQKSVKSNAGIFHLIVNSFAAIHYLIAVILFILILQKNTHFRFWGITMLIVFYLVYGTSLLSMNFADRFPYQLFFPLLLYGVATSDLTATIQQLKLKYIGLFLCIFIFAKGFYSSHAKDLSSMGDNLFSAYYYSRTHLNLALEFRKLNQPKIKVFCNEAGIFPYYANVDYYDPEGLTNKELSTQTITPEYIEQVNPDVFLYLITIPKQEVETWAAHLPKGHPLAYYEYLLTNDTYEKVGYVTCIEYNAYIGVAINKNSPDYSAIHQASENAIKNSEENLFSLRKFLKFKYSLAFPTL